MKIRSPPSQFQSSSNKSSSSSLQLPVLGNPNELKFYKDDRSPQILKIYNPYEFSIEFNLLCTSPRKYIVNCPSGIIKPYCFIDINIQHCQMVAENYNVTDRFRIEAKIVESPHVTGYKDVPSTLFPTKLSLKEDDLNAQFQLVQSKTLFKSEPTQYKINESSGSGLGATSSHAQGSASSLPLQSSSPSPPPPLHLTQTLPAWTYVTAAIVCFTLIGLPSEGEQSPLPSYLRLNSKAKLLAAYVLGLLTTTIFR